MGGVVHSSSGALLLLRHRIVAVVTLVAGLAASSLAAAPPSSAAPSDDRYFSSMISVTNKIFYPQVKDGFKDVASISLDSEDYSNLRATVYNGNGHAVRSLRAQATCQDDCSWFTYQWTWNGRNDDGDPVRKGTYEVLLTATTQIENADGDYADGPVQATRTLTLEGGYMDRRLTEWRKGADTASRSKGRGCYVDTHRQTLELACWRGTYATATWRFTIPADATKVRHNLWGPSGYDHGGLLAMTGRRVSPRTFVVTAKVTKWRQEYFDDISVHYTVRRLV